MQSIPVEIIEIIIVDACGLSNTNYKTMRMCLQVCKQWYRVVTGLKSYKKIIKFTQLQEELGFYSHEIIRRSQRAQGEKLYQLIKNKYLIHNIPQFYVKNFGLTILIEGLDSDFTLKIYESKIMYNLWHVSLTEQGTLIYSCNIGRKCIYGVCVYIIGFERIVAITEDVLTMILTNNFIVP